SEEFFDKYLSSIYRKLKKRWFLRLPDFVGGDEDRPEDVFGYRDLELREDALNNLEPDDIVDCFKSYSFSENNKQVKAWWSPYYQLRASAFGEYASAFRKGCVTHKLIPLFYSDNKRPALWSALIQNLAYDRAQQLLDTNQDNIEFIKEALRDYDDDNKLKSINNYQDVVDNYQDILEVWKNKAGVWAGGVSAYIKEIVSRYNMMAIETADVARAIPIFKHLNEGGIRLSDYDLLVAKAAKKNSLDEESYSLGNAIK